MYAGCIINNIIETITETNNINLIYSPHYSFFDIILSECNINLFMDSYIDKFTNSEKICSIKNNLYLQEYSAYMTNSMVNTTKNSSFLNYHLNLIVFEHSIDILKLKKEDQYILCSNGLRKNNFVVFFNRTMDKWSCANCYPICIDYAIPNKLSIKNNLEDRKKIGFLSLNKAINNINDIYPDADIITSIPESINKLCDTLNNYKLIVELDAGSIINCLAAIGCGCMAIILDTNNILNQYSKIENLLIVSSIEDLNNKIKQVMNMKFDTNTPNFDSYKNFDAFENYINNILITNKNKGFIL
jgi:hypothetical protein